MAHRAFDFLLEITFLGDDVSLRPMLACELRFGGCDDYSMNLLYYYFITTLLCIWGLQSAVRSRAKGIVVMRKWKIQNAQWSSMLSLCNLNNGGRCRRSSHVPPSFHYCFLKELRHGQRILKKLGNFFQDPWLLSHFNYSVGVFLC